MGARAKKPTQGWTNYSCMKPFREGSYALCNNNAAFQNGTQDWRFKPCFKKGFFRYGEWNTEYGCKELFAPYVRYYTSLDLDIMVMLITGILQPTSLAHETVSWWNILKFAVTKTSLGPGQAQEGGGPGGRVISRHEYFKQNFDLLLAQPKGTRDTRTCTTFRMRVARTFS